MRTLGQCLSVTNVLVPTTSSGWNLKGVRFAKPGRPLKSWSVVSFDRYCGIPDMGRSCSILMAIAADQRLADKFIK